MLRKIISVSFVFSSMFLSSGCHQISSRTSLGGDGGRVAYNEVIQKTNEQELLLNIVRNRYLEPIFFLEVGNVTSQFTYGSSSTVSVPIPGFSGGNPFVLGGTLNWQNQPTLQFFPLEGAKFMRQLAQPIGLEIIQYLVYVGWDIKDIFRLLVQSYDSMLNCPMTISGERHIDAFSDKFCEITELFRYFQLRGQLQIGVKYYEKNIPFEKDSKKSEVKKEEKQIKVLQIAFPKEVPEAKRLAQLLASVEEQDDQYVISTKEGFETKARIGIMTRSLLSCIYYLSQSVQVPEKDIISGVAYSLPFGEKDFGAWEMMINSLMKIKCSPVKPDYAFVAVFYRGNWFYIDDRDPDTKKIFILLLQLLQGQAGLEGQGSLPVLALPLG